MTVRFQHMAFAFTFGFTTYLAVADSANASITIHVPADAATIDSAVATVPDGGIIEIALGTYFGGFAYNNLGKAFTIRAATLGTVVLDGSDSQPVFQIHNSVVPDGDAVVFENLVFRNGTSTIDGVAGGVTLSRADATFLNCAFENNSSFAASTGGGGVAVVTSSVAHFIGCKWQGNVAKNEAGGLRVSTDSHAVVHDSQFIENSTNPPNHRNSAAGGGIHVGNASLNVSSTRFEGNSAGYVGGGLYATGNWLEPVTIPRSTVLVANCTFAANIAEADPSVTPFSPPEAGGLHAENQTVVKIYNSRFLSNFAEKGAGANSYRAHIELYDSIFKGNWVDGSDGSTGFGAAIAITSNDTAIDGSTNRPNGSLILRNTLVQGRDGVVTTVAQTAGGLYVAGDKNREYGLAGVQKLGPTTANRSQVAIEDSVFFDCDVTETPQGGKGLGGGFSVEVGDVSATDSMVIDSDAFGPESTGGAVRFVIDSTGSFTRCAFANNSAEQFGGAIFAQGSHLDLDQCIFLENQFSPGNAETVWQSFGAAVFSGPIVNFAGSALPMTGTIADCIFAENEGLPVFDDDRSAGPINDIRYNGNHLHSSTFGTSVYRDSLVSPQSVADLTSLVVTRDGGIPSTEKSLENNFSLGTPPSTATLIAVPSKILARGAAGDAPGATEAFLAWAWSGSSATLNAVPLESRTGVTAASPGTSTLNVDGEIAQAGVISAPASVVTLNATPNTISSGSSASLQWSLVTGSYLDVDIDGGVRLPAGAKGSSGSVSVSPNETTTYRIIATTEEGGAIAETTVWVDETPPSIFDDGFELGNTSAWSGSVGLVL